MQQNELIQKYMQILITAEKERSIDNLQLKDIYCSITESDNPFFNVVIDTRTDRQNSGNEIDACRNFFTIHNKPWLWFLFPGSEKHDLLEHGFSKLRKFQAMYFDLTKPIPEFANTGLEIYEADAQDDLRAWIEPNKRLFRHEKDAESYRLQNVRLLAKGTDFRFFIGMYNGTSVTAGTLFIHEDSAMLCGLATKEEYSKQGFGTALILQRMQAAKDRGIKHLFITTSSENEHLFKKFGFNVYADELIYDPAGFVNY